MKLILSLIGFIIISGNTFGQTVRRLKDEDDTREIYYVLKSDKTIKEGLYVKKMIFGDTICKGIYKNNLKDGLWKFYYYSHIRRVGNYKNDKKVGIWTTFHENGEIETEYDYDNNRLLLHKLFSPDDETWRVITGKDTIVTLLRHPPINLNGEYDYGQILQRNLNSRTYTKDFIRVAKGKVIASFTIDTTGKVVNYKIKKGINSEVDAEVLRVIKLFDTEWLPAEEKNKPLAVEYELQVNFDRRPE